MRQIHWIGCLALTVLVIAGTMTVFAADAKSSKGKVTDEEFEQAVVEYNQEHEGDDEVVCKKRAVTGSRMKQRVCRTRKQMREDEERARLLTKRNQRAGRGASMGATGSGPN